MKYMRSFVMLNDPGFRGSFRDLLNQAEKLELIDDAEVWLNIRGLRHLSAHEYSKTETSRIFKEMKKECHRLLAVKDLVQK